MDATTTTDNDGTTNHGLTCNCGQTFQSISRFEQHVNREQTDKAVLREIRRIGGEKFAELAKQDLEDGHAGDIRDVADAEGLDYTRDNATEIAKESIKETVEHYDEIEPVLRNVVGETVIREPVKVEKFGSSYRVVKHVDDFYYVEQTPLLTDGSREEDVEWAVIGGMPGMSSSRFTGREEALEFFEDVQDLSSEKLKEKYPSIWVEG